MSKSDNGGLMTFGGHLEVLRKMLFRIIAVALTFAVIIFCFRQATFNILLAPSSSDFATYRGIEQICSWFGIDFHFEMFKITLINTELSNQFMTHLSTSVILALLCASPYIVVELFRFITPALYDDERRYSVVVTVIIYVLFIIGVVMNYYILFPFAVRFLGTYQVDNSVVNQINISSYISTFTTLTFMMGLVFQIPVISFFLAKMGILNAETMAHYRRHAIIIIALVAAIITPPDLFTLCLVSLPMWGLYEVSIVIVRRINRRQLENSNPQKTTQD